MLRPLFTWREAARLHRGCIIRSLRPVVACQRLEINECRLLPLFDVAISLGASWCFRVFYQIIRWLRRFCLHSSQTSRRRQLQFVLRLSSSIIPRGLGFLPEFVLYTWVSFPTNGPTLSVGCLLLKGSGPSALM